MNSIESQPAAKSRAQLRRYGLTMAAAFTMLGVLMWWRGRTVWPYLLGTAAAFALSGLIVPMSLKYPERAWLRLALVLARIGTTIMLTLLFYLVITPLGLIRRLLEPDPFGLHFDATRHSYWKAIEPDGPGSRINKPY